MGLFFAFKGKKLLVMGPFFAYGQKGLFIAGCVQGTII